MNTREKAYRKTKLKFPTISSRTYSGKNLKTSGCSDFRGSLIGSISAWVQKYNFKDKDLLDGFVGSIF